MSDGFEGYDIWKLRSPEDERFYRFGRPPKRAPLRCIVCGAECDGSHGLRCDAHAERDEEAGTHG